MKALAEVTLVGAGLGGACVSTGTVMVTRVCSACRRGAGPVPVDGCLRMDTGAAQGAASAAAQGRAIGSEACRRMGGVAVLVGTTGSET